MAWWSVETQIVSKTFASCKAVNERPNNETPSIFRMFLSFIPLEPPLASINAVTALELLVISSKQTSEPVHDVGTINKLRTKNFCTEMSITFNLTEAFNLGDYSNETDSCINQSQNVKIGIRTDLDHKSQLK